MPVGSLQHINTRSANVERTRDFYVGVLGLSVGPRPPFASSGYWLYLGDQPIVHLVQARPGEAGDGDGTGNLHHIAFEGIDLEGTRQELRARAITFWETVTPRDRTVQLFVHDPDGILLELNFPPE
jgi:catechol 2,3-dioxygenase-like lactoylglutathione lyase family enzyme